MVALSSQPGGNSSSESLSGRKATEKQKHYYDALGIALR